MGRHVHRRNGLTKRCGCPCRVWTKCEHPWHSFLQWQNREYRYQLCTVAGKPRGYVMGKTEAQAVFAEMSTQIRKGTFSHPKHGRTVADPTGQSVDQHLTLNDVVEEYKKKHVWKPGRRAKGGKIMEYNLAAAQRVEVPGPNGRTIRLGEKILAEITKADLEAARGPLTTWKPGAKGGHVGANRILRRLRHLFNWAIVEGYVDHSPFKRFGVPVVKMDGAAETPRHRRLDGDEEQRLLKHATPYLQDVIVAALETGCRRGELLSLTWADVRDDYGHMLLRADNTKTGEARAVPITARLRDVLRRRRIGADVEEFGPDAFVFGNEVGEQRRWIHDAWDKARRSAGIADLHFHDLRREFASRLLETPGVSLHDVSDWIGHTNVITTSRYLATSAVRKLRVLERFEAARGSQSPSATEPAAATSELSQAS